MTVLSTTGILLSRACCLPASRRSVRLAAPWFVTVTAIVRRADCLDRWGAKVGFEEQSGCHNGPFFARQPALRCHGGREPADATPTTMARTLNSGRPTGFGGVDDRPAEVGLDPAGGELVWR